jgi:hypothetical protein
VIALCAHGAIVAQTGTGPRCVPDAGVPTVTVVAGGAPNRLVPVNVSLPPGRRSGVIADVSAPGCQQSPAGLTAVGADVLTVNGKNADAVAENCPMTTGFPFTASARVALTVVRPAGSPVAMIESPMTVTTGGAPGTGNGHVAASPAAGAQSPPRTSNAVAMPVRLRMRPVIDSAA